MSTPTGRAFAGVGPAVASPTSGSAAGPSGSARELARIRAIVIPPAWTDVWICPRADGHIQAIGRDARGRRQYRYHAGFRARRDRGKFARIVRFAERLPRIRRRVREDLRRPGLPREKVLAAVVALLEVTRLRVGNPQYARLNRSFGLSTLRDRHATRDRRRPFASGSGARAAGPRSASWSTDASRRSSGAARSCPARTSSSTSTRTARREPFAPRTSTTTCAKQRAATTSQRQGLPHLDGDRPRVRGAPPGDGRARGRRCRGRERGRHFLVSRRWRAPPEAAQSDRRGVAPHGRSARRHRRRDPERATSIPASSRLRWGRRAAERRPQAGRVASTAGRIGARARGARAAQTGGPSDPRCKTFVSRRGGRGGPGEAAPPPRVASRGRTLARAPAEGSAPMCMNCGCGQPHDDHGKPENITADELQRAGDGQRPVAARVGPAHRRDRRAARRLRSR